MRDERGALIFIQIALRPDTARPLGRAGAESGEARPKKYFLGDAERSLALAFLHGGIGTLI